MQANLIPNRRLVLQKIGAVGLCTSPVLSGPVFASTFMTQEQAQKILHPLADTFEPITLLLDQSKLNAIANESDTNIPNKFNPIVWRAMHAGQMLGWVMSDRVIGKFDLIDYAAGFDIEGASLGLEVLSYRESHGAEIKNSAWRKQFIGKKSPHTMRFADDIRNISGATLSCQHVTEGMQRLSALASLLASKK